MPAHGTFPELISDTGGGLLCKPHDATDIAAKLAELLHAPDRAHQLGQSGQQAVRNRYNAQVMAESTRSLYAELLLNS
jgi:glycosyltransferase involved in cell wall biosynthesis